MYKSRSINIFCAFSSERYVFQWQHTSKVSKFQIDWFGFRPHRQNIIIPSGSYFTHDTSLICSLEAPSKPYAAPKPKAFLQSKSAVLRSDRAIHSCHCICSHYCSSKQCRCSKPDTEGLSFSQRACQRSPGCNRRSFRRWIMICKTGHHFQIRNSYFDRAMPSAWKRRTALGFSATYIG